MKPRFTESSWAVLAGIRFILAFIVIIRHLMWFAPIPKKLDNVLILGGRASVLGFLLISGLSIGHSYIQRPEGYLKRRFLRIYPLYFAAVLSTEVITLIVGSPYKLSGGLTLIDSGWETPLANLFFLQGLFSNTISYNDPLWSLGAEIFYYLLAPILLWLKVEVLLALIILSMITFSFYPRGWHFEYTALRYAWPWLIGFLFLTKNQHMLVAVLLLMGTAIIAFIKSDASEPLSWLTFSLVSICSLVVGFKDLSIPKTYLNILSFFGEISYPLYLFHMPVYLFWYHFFGVRNAWHFIALTILLIIPVNFIIDHWLKRIFWKQITEWFIIKASSIRLLILRYT